MVIAKPLHTTPSPSTSPRRSPRSGGDLYVYTIYQYRPLNDIIIKKRRLRRSPFTCVIWQIPPLPTVGDNLALRGCSSLPRHASGLRRQNRHSATLVKNRICHGGLLSLSEETEKIRRKWRSPSCQASHMCWRWIEVLRMLEEDEISSLQFLHWSFRLNEIEHRLCFP